MGLITGLLVTIMALVVGSGKIGLFARDWAPVLAMMAIYGVAFELAAKLGMPTWYAPQIDVDRAIGFGHVPSVWLQQELGASHNQVLAVASAIAYASHYYFPVLLGLYLWWYHRETAFFGLMYGLLTALFLSTVVFVLAPTAPPWLAAERGMLPPIHDVVKMGLLDLRLDCTRQPQGRSQPVPDPGRVPVGARGLAGDQPAGGDAKPDPRLGAGGDAAAAGGGVVRDRLRGRALPCRRAGRHRRSGWCRGCWSSATTAASPPQCWAVPRSRRRRWQRPARWWWCEARCRWRPSRRRPARPPPIRTSEWTAAAAAEARVRPPQRCPRCPRRRT